MYVRILLSLDDIESLIHIRILYHKEIKLECYNKKLFCVFYYQIKTYNKPQKEKKVISLKL